MSHWDSASQGVLAVVVSFIVAFLAWVATQALSLPYIYSLPLTLLSALLTGLMLAAWPASRDAPPDESSDPVPAGWARVPADIDEALYWDLFENASDIVFTTDISGRFVTGNRAVERLLGYTVQEAQQLTWEKLVASYEMSKARKMFRRHASGEQFINYELDVVVKSGEIRTFEIGSRPLFEKGELVGFHGIARDVTDRKRIQKAAILARQEAEQASQAKSFFLANMSHEIRTPINGILGFLSLLSKTALDSRQKDFLRPIEQSAKNLLRIVDDILDLSKIEAGKITIKREPVKLADAVLGVVELQRPLALEKKLRLRCDIDWEIPARLLGDGTRIAQVTANLVSNAIKFTERGEINVTARLFDETKHSVKVEIVVRDTGIGIPSHSLERLFEPFRQLDPARDRRSTGSGLGLAITKNLVSAMGGEMQLDSDPGRYTEVRVVLPLDKSTAVDGHSQTAEQSFDGRGLRVLVVDDNDINRHYLAELLRSLGIVVMEASGGGQAIDVMRGNAIDLVLMDIHMAGMDGVEATARIRSSPDIAQVPVVAVSADVMGDGLTLMQQGLDGFIAKPVHEQVLLRTLASHFPRRVRRRDGGLHADAGPCVTPRERKALDQDLGIELASGSESLWRKSLQTLLRNLPHLIKELDSALARPDLVALSDQAHQLAGTASYVAATDLAEAARALEQACTGPDPSAVSGRLGNLRDAANRLMVLADNNGIYVPEKKKPAPQA